MGFYTVKKNLGGFVESCIEKGNSLFIVDNNYKYKEEYYIKLLDNGYSVKIIDLNEFDGDSFNPLLYPYQLYMEGKIDKSIDMLDTLLSLIYYSKDDIDPFWNDTAKNIVLAVILGLFKNGDSKLINLPYVSSVFNNIDDFFSKIDDKSILELADNTLKAPFDTRQSIITVAKQQMNLYSIRENFNMVISNNSIELSELNNKTAIIVEWDITKTFYSKYISMILLNIFDYITDNNIFNYSFIIDNFDSFNPIKDLDKFIIKFNDLELDFIININDIVYFKSLYNEYILNNMNLE